MTHKLICAALAALVLAGCKSGNTVRITNDAPPPVVAKQRSEPIFYNGKTYQLDFGPIGNSAVFELAVSGMSAGQKKDAVAVATSSLAYYACPDGQRGQLQNEPSYTGAKWRMQAKCG